MGKNMPEKKFIKMFRRIKLIQLLLIFIIDVTFIVILLKDRQLSFSLQDISNGSSYALMYLMIWILILLSILFILYDLFKMRQFAIESHDLYRMAYLDRLTGIPNRHGLDTILESYPTAESLANIGCCVLAIDNIAELNIRLGREAGDKMIYDFASILEKIGDRFGTVGRNSGNVYVAVIDKCDKNKMDTFFKELYNELENYNSIHKDAPIVLRTSYILNSDTHASSFKQIFAALYHNIGIN
jgi:diguanylate cyclase (GGDEF)-like protein